MRLDVPRYYERYRIGSLRPRLRRRARRQPHPTDPAVETIVTTTEPATGQSRTVVAPLALPDDPPTPDAHAVAPDAPPPDPDSPSCRCGFQVGHHFIRPRCEFTGTGWVLITIGVNPPPRAVRLECAVCGDTLMRITDRARIDEMQW